ncbi:hypothetical protein BEN30_01695 [Magnetovibrio blakemorei]|uniref:Uncharacterized protein n=1 Tax=Magnetovibrio blakemorei TaxID=28181 RepID=A0A1E5Q2S5_9PROT|nr:hypothetical protein BEN30_01695 [Magnetovibrio blakemorei]
MLIHGQKRYLYIVVLNVFFNIFVLMKAVLPVWLCTLWDCLESPGTWPLIEQTGSLGDATSTF